MFPHADDLRHDLATDSFSLVKTCPPDQRGTTYPGRARLLRASGRIQFPAIIAWLSRFAWLPRGAGTP
jgi:hypothetical protein